MGAPVYTLGSIFPRFTHLGAHAWLALGEWIPEGVVGRWVLSFSNLGFPAREFVLGITNLESLIQTSLVFFSVRLRVLSRGCFCSSSWFNFSCSLKLANFLGGGSAKHLNSKCCSSQEKSSSSLEEWIGFLYPADEKLEFCFEKRQHRCENLPTKNTNKNVDVSV